MEERRVAVGGIHTRALSVEGDGPPALLVHGWTDSADTWRPVLERLDGLGRAGIAYDLPGFGHALPLEPGPVFPQLERFLIAAIERTADAASAPIVVSGNSLGGWVSLRVAEQPDLPIAGLVPIAPAGLEMWPWFFVADRIPALAAIVGAPFPVPTPIVRQVVGRLFKRLAFGDPLAADPDIVRRFVHHNGTRKVLRERIVQAQRLRPHLDSPFSLERINYPTIVVWGDRDRLCVPISAQPLTDALPDARLEMIEGCGHCPQLEAPDRVVEALTAFSVETGRRDSVTYKSID